MEIEAVCIANVFTLLKVLITYGNKHNIIVNSKTLFFIN